MYKLCVFDMDGTFVNSISDICDAMNRSLKALGYKTYTEDDYRKMVGDGMLVLCERALPNNDRGELEKLISLYKKDYLNNCCIKTAPYDGMVDLVYDLKRNGIKSAILSNKPHNQVIEISDKLFEDKLFDEIIGNSDRFPTKPATDALVYLMNKYNVTNEETVYIGDSDVDMILGKRAGVFTIGASWGFRGEKELLGAGADAVVQNADDLKNLILH